MAEIKTVPEDTINQHEHELPTDSSDEHIALKTDTFEIHDSALGINLQKGYYYNWRFAGVVLGSIISNNVYIMPYIFSANAMPMIEADLGSKNAIWISLAYTLCTSVCLLLFGRLTDIFGRRYFVLGGHTFALLGCIIAATAQHINALIGGMVFVGLAAGVQQCWVVFLGELIANKHRPIVIGCVFFSSWAGYGLAPAIARSLLVATDGNWRWCFYIPIILNAVLVAIFAFCYFPPRFQQLHVHRSIMEQIKRVDFVGVILFVAGLLLFLMGLSWGGSVYPWKSAHVIATIVVGFGVLIAFVAWEWFYTGDQIMPLRLFKAPGFVPMIICASIGTCVAYSAAIIWPAEVNGLLPGTPETHGYLSSIQTGVTLVGMGLSGVIIRYLPYHKQFLILSCIILTAFTGALASVQPGETAKASTLMAFAGLGLGLIESASRSLLPLSCPDEDIGSAIGVLGTVGYACAAVATAIYVTVLTTKLTTIVPGMVSEAAIQAGFPESDLTELLTLYSTNITAVPGMTPQIAEAVGVAAQNGTADAFRYVWYTAVAFGVVAITSSCFVISYSKYYTDNVARKMRIGRAGRDAAAVEHGGVEKGGSEKV